MQPIRTIAEISTNIYILTAVQIPLYYKLSLESNMLCDCIINNIYIFT